MATGVQPKHLKFVEAFLSSPLAIVATKFKALSPGILDDFRELSAGHHSIGIAGEYVNDTSQPLALSGLAFATGSLVLVIEFDKILVPQSDEIDPAADSDDEADDLTTEEVESFKMCIANLLHNTDRNLLAFNADKLALALYSLDLRVNNMVDLQSALPVTWKLPRYAPDTYAELLGGKGNTYYGSLEALFKDEIQRDGSFHNLAFRAWSAFVAQNFNELQERITDLPKIDTYSMDSQVANQHLACDDIRI